jgi:Mrp family chromosome partitioning ATPase
MGLVAGTLLSVILLLLRAVTNTGIKTVRQLNGLGLPVLAVLPEQTGEFKDNLVYSLPGRQCKKILFTEFPQSEDNPFTASEIAGGLARDNSRVLIVECNLSSPCLKNKMELGKDSGVSDVLIGKVKAESVIQNHKKNVDVIAAGSISVNPDKLLASDEMREMLENLSAKYDYMLLLSSAEKADPGIISLAKCASGTVIITSRKITRADVLKEYLDCLQAAGANVLGTVFYNNKRK